MICVSYSNHPPGLPVRFGGQAGSQKTGMPGKPGKRDTFRFGFTLGYPPTELVAFRPCRRFGKLPYAAPTSVRIRYQTPKKRAALVPKMSALSRHRDGRRSAIGRRLSRDGKGECSGSRMAEPKSPPFPLERRSDANSRRIARMPATYAHWDRRSNIALRPLARRCAS